MTRLTVRQLPPAAVAALLTLVFIGVSFWWAIADRRVPDYDSGRHLTLSYLFHESLRDGDLLEPLERFTRYPPLVHTVGALSAFAGGFDVDRLVMAQNLVFLPLLVAGCYGTARLYAGPVAGVLATAFVLGTPMVVSQFHAYMLDAPQAALVALTVWLVLASDRFAKVGLSGLAGVATGLAMLAKQTSLFFGLGLVAVVLLRGGWRNVHGVAAFAVPALALTAPWYLAHFHDLRPYAEGAVSEGGTEAPTDLPGALYPERWTDKNAGWYFWNLVNNQTLLPLMLLFLVGTVFGAVAFVRRRRPDDYFPELFVGGLVAYFSLTFVVSLHDPRYTLPALVYIAALGTGWIVRVRRPIGVAAASVLGIVVVVNFIGVSFGLGEAKRVALPGAPRFSILHEREFTLYSPEGWPRGGPSRGGDIPATMRAAYRDGVRVMEFDPSIETMDFNGAGLEALALSNGMVRPPVYRPDTLGPMDAFMLRRVPSQGDAPPCTTLDDGTGVYLVLGNPFIPFERYRLYCPTRTPAFYGPGA